MPQVPLVHQSAEFLGPWQVRQMLRMLPRSMTLLAEPWQLPRGPQRTMRVMPGLPSLGSEVASRRLRLCRPRGF